MMIEAFKWTGGPDQTEDPDWIVEAMKNGICKIETWAGGPTIRMKIRTLEGEIYADQGDYIIRGIKGELYPCKPDIFAETYESVP